MMGEINDARVKRLDTSSTIGQSAEFASEEMFFDVRCYQEGGMVLMVLVGLVAHGAVRQLGLWK